MRYTANGLTGAQAVRVIGKLQGNLGRIRADLILDAKVPCFLYLIIRYLGPFCNKDTDKKPWDPKIPGLMEFKAKSKVSRPFQMLEELSR